MEDGPHTGLALGVKVVETGVSVAFVWLDKLLYALKKDNCILLYRLQRKN